ncbi:MAG: tetratricopeptide repeat protein, partial [Clostridia bacterium]|nr:tetratricopeptide repeat protein [Clostridia bacterium]
MALVPAICTECGAQINIDDSKEAGICTHCGTAFITEKAINNYVTNNTTNITNNVTKIIYGNEKEEGEDFYNRALTYIKLDDKNKAKSELEKAIELNPEKALYRIQLFDLNMNS